MLHASLLWSRSRHAVITLILRDGVRIDNIGIMPVTRRQFNRISTMAAITCLAGRGRVEDKPQIPVAIAKCADRRIGIPKAIELLGKTRFNGEKIYLKGNFNSTDRFPSSTHPQALSIVAEILRANGGSEIVLAERSGMGLARKIWQALGILDWARNSGIKLLPLEELPAKEWEKIRLSDSHWSDGIEAPRFLVRHACVVQICNLKTHRFGGQFSASLKNSVGLIAKHSFVDSKRNYMMELHKSANQCQMIAEVNQIYSPALLVMDAMQVFIRGGPERGELADPGVIAASQDRVALDAVGLALLRYHGAGVPLNRTTIFNQEQIKRAVELGLGAGSANKIRLLTSDAESRDIATKLENILLEGSNG
jgi:uncharacterized protein (DUF362 family)